MAEDSAPDDLTSLAELSNSAVLEGVQNRYVASKIYTRINALLIAVNPYEWLDLYGQEAMKAYQEAPAGTLPPHVFATSAAAYTGLLSKFSQSIVISGESGAGKSETAKKLLAHIGYCASPKVEAGGAAGPNIEQRIMASNPILEAYGNAKVCAPV